jgi:hypothetical protein
MPSIHPLLALAHASPHVSDRKEVVDQADRQQGPAVTGAVPGPCRGLGLMLEQELLESWCLFIYKEQTTA